MPAQLRVFTPNAPPLCAWIESEVIRLGSDPDCDICVDHIEPHQATLVFRDGKYLYVNRSAATASLGGHEIAPGGELEWKDLAVLRVNPRVSIALVCHEDPAPLSAEPWRKMPSFEEPDLQRQSAKKRRKELTSFVVSLVAIFVTALMWSKGAANSSDYYRQTLQTVGAAPPKLRARYTDAIGWMQKGHSLEQRGEYEIARHAYLQAREVVVRLRIGVDEQELHSELLDFLNYRIARI